MKKEANLLKKAPGRKRDWSKKIKRYKRRWGMAKGLWKAALRLLK
ncbi:MAG: hypothetical protein Q4E91_11735 [Lachnospiraceae bacterium]|nr:hypothetical protein [Lachnospiraceae bacterium]